MRKLSTRLVLSAFFCLALGVMLGLSASQARAGISPNPWQDSAPQPTPDAFEAPDIPTNPSEVQAGELVYYYHCMPCHGDHGQGLTDEFRGLWVEDHQNCWAIGCHGGRVSDEGFPIPKYIPAVSDRIDQLLRYPSPEDLYAYLERTHPPQYPGALEDEQYWAVTALLLFDNQRLAADGHVGPQQIDLPRIEPVAGIIGFIAACALVAGLLIWQSKSTPHSVSPRKE